MLNRFSKKTWAIIVLAAVSVSLVTLFFIRKPKETPLPAQAPTLELKITKFVPPEKVLFAAGTQDPIFIYTDHEVDPFTVIATASPSLKFDALTRYDDPLRLILTPQKNWVMGQTYQIFIAQGMASKDRRYILPTDFSTTIQLEAPPPLGGGEAN